MAPEMDTEIDHGTFHEPAVLTFRFLFLFGRVSLEFNHILIHSSTGCTVMVVIVITSSIAVFIAFASTSILYSYMPSPKH